MTTARRSFLGLVMVAPLSMREALVRRLPPAGRLAEIHGPSPFSAAAGGTWLRADVGVTVVDGRVTAWADQSGNGNHAVAAREATP